MDAASWAQDLSTLRRLARHLVSDEAEAEDVAVEALHRARSASSKVRNTQGYAAGIVRFRARRLERAAARRRHHEGVRAARAQADSPAADELAERVELLRIVLGEIGRLPAAQGRALTLRYLDEVSIAEIAEREGKTSSTVRSLLSRGLATLRERLDGRFGERASWSSLLVPWALVSPPTAGPSADGSGPHASAEPAAGSPVGALGGALLTMTALKASLLVVPLAALGAWFLLSSTNSEQAGPVRPASPEPEATSALAASSPVEVEGPLSGPGRRTTAGDPTSADELQRFPVRGRVTDAGLTPAPEVEVRITPLEGDLTGSELHATTEADGQFALDEDLPAMQVMVQLYDANDRELLAAFPEPLSFPFEEDLVADLPPVIRFVFSGADVPADQPCIVRVADMRTFPANVRAGALPWARFSEPLPERARELLLEVDGGYLQAVTPIPPGERLFATPLEAHFRECGRVEFELEGQDLRLYNAVRLDPVGIEGKPHFPAFQLEAGTQRAAVGYLRPGRYRWSFQLGEEERSGECVVEPRKTSRVQLQPFEAGRARSDVLIDATALADEDLTRWFFQFVNEDNPVLTVKPTVVPEGAPGSGLWRASAEGLPQGKWMLFINCEEGYRATPHLTPLVLGGSAGPVVIAPTVIAEVRVQVVDAETGEPIPEARLWIQEGLKRTPSVTSSSGVFEGVKLPQGVDVALFASAEGYGLAQLDREASNEAVDLVLRLKRGWRNRVYVFDLANKQLAEGLNVHIDGELAGQTDEQGAYWFDREQPPKRIEIGRGQAGVQVRVDPFEMGVADSMDAPGYIFVVNRD